MENHQSIQFYKERLKQVPHEPENYVYLIQCYLKSDQVSEAGKVIAAGLNLFPEHALLHYFNGEALSRQGKPEEALQAWEKSAELDPKLIDGRFSRAYLFERAKRYLEAAQEWRLIIAFMQKYEFQDEFPKRDLCRIFHVRFLC